TCDAFMVDGAALFTRNFYQRIFKPDGTDAHYLKVARLSSLIIVVGGLVIALTLPNVVRGILMLLKVTAFFGISFWMGVIWKRANRYGAWASFLISSGVWAIMISWSHIMNFLLNIGIISGQSHFFSPDFKFTDALQMAIYLPLGFITMIVVSLFTRPEPKEQIHKFFSLLHTPVGEERKLKEAGIEMIYEGESS
ncbi:hypothetical protein KAW18_16470, partial [candidate division WOR-3 bacterium]|nr:hypothetical protein [candidate division WOR-3 bacterium]